MDVCHGISSSINISGESELYQYQKVRLDREQKLKKMKLKQNSADSALFYCHY